MTPELIEAIAALLWPVMALVSVAMLAPLIRERLRKGDVSIRIGDFELTAQQASEQIRKQVEDLQARVAALPTVTKNAAGARAEDVSLRTRALSVLWVDDEPQNNATLITALRESGHTVTLARDSAEALGLMRTSAFDLVLSDVARPEGRRAGLDLLRRARGFGFETPFGLYTSATSADRHRDEALTMGAAFATSSSTDLLAEIGRIAVQTDKGP